MTDSRIKEKIIQDARADADRILEDAKKSVEEIVLQSKKKVQGIKEETGSLAEHEKRKEIERRLSTARMQSRTALLKEKRAIIDGVFDEAKKRLQDLKKSEYIRFIARLIKEEVTTGNPRLVLSKHDLSKHGEGAAKEILSSISAKSVPIEKGDFDGGCIVRKETYEFNATIDTILARIKEQLESELQKTLFG